MSSEQGLIFCTLHWQTTALALSQTRMVPISEKCLCGPGYERFNMISTSTAENFPWSFSSSGKSWGLIPIPIYFNNFEVLPHSSNRLLRKEDYGALKKKSPESLPRRGPWRCKAEQSTRLVTIAVVHYVYSSAVKPCRNRRGKPQTHNAPASTF